MYLAKRRKGVTIAAALTVALSINGIQAVSAEEVRGGEVSEGASAVASITPAYAQVTAKAGDTVTLTQSGGTLPEGTTFVPSKAPEGWTLKATGTNGDVTITIPRGAEPADWTLPMSFAFPDGTPKVIKAKVLIRTEAGINSPTYGERVTVPLNKQAIIAGPTNKDGSDLPAGARYSIAADVISKFPGSLAIGATDGSVTMTLQPNVTPGQYGIPVTVTYPDGTTDNVSLPIAVDGKDSTPLMSETYEPAYAAAEGLAGETTIIKVNKPLPKGTTLTFPKIRKKDGTESTGWVFGYTESGDIKVTAPADAAPGNTLSFNVRVNYPDWPGLSYDVTPVTFKVKAPETNYAQNLKLAYQEATGKAGVATKVTLTGDSIPQGTTFSTPDDYQGWKISDADSSGTFTVTPPADAGAGAKLTIPVRATFPDRTVGNLTATFVVEGAKTNYAEKYSPSYAPAEGAPGTTTLIQLAAGTTYPQGTTFTVSKAPAGWTFGTPAANGSFNVTAPSGAKLGTTLTIPVRVTYPDKTYEDIQAKLTLPAPKEKHSEKYPLEYAAATAPAGKAYTVHQTATIPKGTTFTVAGPKSYTLSKPNQYGSFDVTAPASAAAGSKATLTVTATYPDGTSKNFTIPFTVAKAATNQAGDYEPAYEDISVEAGKSVTAAITGGPFPQGTQFAVGTAPSGWAVKVAENGALTVTAPANATPGSGLNIPVNVVYPDGTLDQVVAKASVPHPADTTPLAEKYAPEYADGSGLAGQAGQVAQTQSIPVGTKISLPADSNGWSFGKPSANGSFTVTPPADAAPGRSISGHAVFAYPDGSSEKVAFSYTVKAAQAPKTPLNEKHDPQYAELSGLAGQSKTATLSDTVPENTKFIMPTVIDGWTLTPATADGSFTITPDKSVRAGSVVTFPVMVVYSDGTTDRADLKFTVTKPDTNYAGGADITYSDISGKPGVAQTTSPAGKWKVSGEFTVGAAPAGWSITVGEKGAITVTSPKDATPGTTLKVPVRVTFSDGTYTDRSFTYTVKPATENKETYNPSWPEITVKPGQSASAAFTGGNLPAGTVFKVGTAPSGWAVSITEKGVLSVSAPADAKNGAGLNIPINVVYPDGTFDQVTAHATVQTEPKKPLAERYDLEYRDITGLAGQQSTAGLPGGTAYPHGTVFTPGKAPEGWVFGTPDSQGRFTITPPADATPGTTVTIPVTIKYTDGSKDSSTFTFTVKSSQAPDPVDPAEPVDPTDPVDPADPTQPEDPAEPTGPQDSESHQPEYSASENGAVEPGKTITFTQSASLPKGTKVVLPRVPAGWTITGPQSNGSFTVTVPEGITPGTELTLPLTVVYPDNSADKVSVKLTVTSPDSPADPVDPADPAKPTNAEEFNPQFGGAPADGVTPGSTVDIGRKSGGAGSVPYGTKYELGEQASEFPGRVTIDKDSGKVSATIDEDAPAGEYTIPVVVKYPDKSFETVDVSVVVKNSGSEEPGTDDPGTDKPGTGGTDTGESDGSSAGSSSSSNSDGSSTAGWIVGVLAALAAILGIGGYAWQAGLIPGVKGGNFRF